MAAVVPLRTTPEDRADRHCLAWRLHLLLTLRAALNGWHDRDENGWFELGDDEPFLRLRYAALRVSHGLTVMIEYLTGAGGLTEMIEGLAHPDAKAGTALFDELGNFANELLLLIEDARAAQERLRRRARGT